MVFVDDLVRRAKVCAECHVGLPARDGTPARDVNHDMIAAGHPRLNFEFSAFFENMPHHWRDAVDPRQSRDVGPDATTDFSARSWVIGQVVSAQASLALLSDRSRQALAEKIHGEPTRWPEFTEYSCFSCHHDLRDEPWRRNRDQVATLPGSNRWGTWYFPMIEILADFDAGPEVKEIVTALDCLRSLMNQPDPDPAVVERQSIELSRKLDPLLTRLSTRNFVTAEVEKLIAAIKQREPSKTWDEATNRYLALVPLADALRKLDPGRDSSKDESLFKQIEDQLRFQNTYDSPKLFNPNAVPR